MARGNGDEAGVNTSIPQVRTGAVGDINVGTETRVHDDGCGENKRGVQRMIGEVGLVASPMEMACAH